MMMCRYIIAYTVLVIRHHELCWIDWLMLSNTIFTLTKQLKLFSYPPFYRTRWKHTFACAQTETQIRLWSTEKTYLNQRRTNTDIKTREAIRRAREDGAAALFRCCWCCRVRAYPRTQHLCILTGSILSRHRIKCIVRALSGMYIYIHLLAIYIFIYTRINTIYIYHFIFLYTRSFVGEPNYVYVAVRIALLLVDMLLNTPPSPRHQEPHPLSARSMV